MAVRGLSLAERQEYILVDDPAHPDQIKKEVEARVKKRGGDVSAEEKEQITDKVVQDAGKPTVFYLGNLLQEDRVFLGDLTAGLEQTPQGNMRMLMRNTNKAHETVRRGLKGWDNFIDGNGKSLKFETAPGTGERGQPRSFVSDECLAYLHHDMLRELAGEILRINGVSSDIEKKFAAALQQSAEDHSPDGLVESAATPTS